ncbi:MAG: GYDIA family GHMP kinase [Prolixibacteraceae bacterium]
MSIPSTYCANGKILLTGEYLVLHGAKAIALPLQVGQKLTVSEEPNSNSILWKANYLGETWFECRLNPKDMSVFSASHPEKGQTISEIFQTIKMLDPDFQLKAGTNLETSLNANPEWGFGSSSTLISLLSQWAKVNPFRLNELVFKGSGFDIACATADGPVFYMKNKPVQPATLDYPFTNQLFFLYSGRKKATAKEVKSFLKEQKVTQKLIEEASGLSDEFTNCTNQLEFNRLIRQHEQLIGKLIGKTPVKPEYFADFSGEIKSLGAWGGDFYLVSSEIPFQEIKNYFENKGLSILFHWDDLILKR